MKQVRQLRGVAPRLAAHSILLIASAAMAAAQTQNSVEGCSASLAAKLYFSELRTRFVQDNSSVDESEFRRAARDYIRLAEQCYELTAGASASGQMIDQGGMWMSPAGPTTDAPVSAEYSLFSTKWGAGSPFASGVDVAGPRLPGGTVSYSFMADAVSLNAEIGGALPNVAITSLATFAPCFLDEIELAFGAWSAVSNILFVPVTDGGGAFNVEPAGDIRIGAHVFDGPSGTLAHGYFPPPNGITAAGDIHFDSAEMWSCAPAAGSFAFGIVALHEIGHAIGLNHEGVQLAVMNGTYNAALTFGPLADDIIGAGEIYGEAGAATTAFFGPVGIGTRAPSAKLHIQGSNARFLVEETGPFSDSNVLFQIRDASTPTFQLENTGNNTLWNMTVNAFGDYLFKEAPDPLATMRLEKVSGNLVLPQGKIVTQGPTCGGAGCDFVFQPEYRLESIEEHAEAMWRDSHLPAVGPTAENAPNFDVTEKVGGILNELEKAHIYIERLHEHAKQQQARMMAELAEKDRRLAAAEDRLARIEALLAERSGNHD